jgi:hypothetical protein
MTLFHELVIRKAATGVYTIFQIPVMDWKLSEFTILEFSSQKNPFTDLVKQLNNHCSFRWDTFFFVTFERFQLPGTHEVTS